MGRVPKVGDTLNTDDFEMIMEAVEQRQKNFDEPPVLSMALVFGNIGQRFAPVICLEGEWEGVKQDVPKGEGDPKCPNGHPLRAGPPLKLGWVKVSPDSTPSFDSEGGFQFFREYDGSLSLESAVDQALRVAVMCWANVKGAGVVVQEDRLKEIANALLRRILSDE